MTDNNRLESKVKFVSVNETYVISTKNETPYIGTKHLVSCVGILIYEENRRIGGVSHICFDDEEFIKQNQVYLQNISWYERKNVIKNTKRNFYLFKDFIRRLIQEADEIVGEKYKISIFNVNSDYRTEEQNEELQKVIRETIETLKKYGKLTDFEDRPETSFMVDIRNGKILPYP